MRKLAALAAVALTLIAASGAGSWKSHNPHGGPPGHSFADGH
jgi:hypothetical protein